MAIHDQLHDIGLNDSEIKVYLYLLEAGISSPPVVSKGTGIARSNLHIVLKTLEQKGLVKRHLQGKRHIYVPSDPSATLILLDRKREAMEDALMELTARYKSQKNKPVIRFYDGVTELQQIFDDALLTKNKEIFGFASTVRLFALMPRYFEDRFQKQLKKREIRLRDILSHDSGEKVAEMTKQNAGWGYEYKIIDKKYGDLPSDILVWDDKVAVMSLEAPVFGTVTQNQALADTYRVQFEIMWNALK